MHDVEVALLSVPFDRGRQFGHRILQVVSVSGNKLLRAVDACEPIAAVPFLLLPVLGGVPELLTL